ncbi:hypothetical protein DL89DRAFT_260338 [Linderina pennispora]|uniref:Matrin-type domain-containing protein n=1 Tax=Linderina pennispora TaxID=61395 RepID=A0A1Y1VZN4_9FUNG|nr:uncharacterized protein DL89DRAFT_260338 [Linderina pennispora]ORX66314.1 hypothetical protein DL89DRAFT_260338 [Linderina pennispora]
MSQKRKAPWDRNTKYWCRYCSIFVHDNSSSRRIHESGVKHKENVQRYLRNIDETAETAAKAESALQRQLDKIEQAASDAYSKDVGSTTASQPAAKLPPAPPEPVEEAEPTEKQKEPAVDSRPADIGLVGGWEVVGEEEDESAGGTRSSHTAADGGAATPAADEPASQKPLNQLRGSEWLDDEDVGNPEAFEVAEKTLLLRGSDSNGAHAADNDAAAGASGLFKKRRVGSRNARKK